MVFPRTTEDVAAIVKITAEHGVPIVGRGAGTGLSGGAIPRAGGVTIGFSRMNRILEIDIENERAVLQPGVVNLDITLAVQALGYFYAPDPSSQRACTIGGNVAENSGGPHTLAYGVTTNHVLGLEFVMPDGTVHTTGGKEPDPPGYDLTGLLTGSEGTMALVTKIIVRLMRPPEKVKTILAVYNAASDAADTVAEITACAITPVAVEMLDGEMLRMVEVATHAGYPMDAAAVLLIELEGLVEAVEEQTEQIREACERCGAREFRRGEDGRRARPAVERPQECFRRGGPRQHVLLRAGWRGAAHPDRAHAALHRGGREEARARDQQYLPCGRWQYASRLSCSIRTCRGNWTGPERRARIFSLLHLRGGSITGEHGVGMEKNEMMGKLFSADSLDYIGRFKTLFDPKGRLNPGKVLPTGTGCLEIRQAPLTRRNRV